MKKYKIIRKNMALYKVLLGVISAHDDHKNSYFWSPPSSASQRRAREWEKTIQFALNGVVYDIRQGVSYSCKNVYYNLRIEVDGSVKNIRSLKKLVA